MNQNFNDILKSFIEKDNSKITKEDLEKLDNAIKEEKDTGIKDMDPEYYLGELSIQTKNCLKDSITVSDVKEAAENYLYSVNQSNDFKRLINNNEERLDDLNNTSKIFSRM